MATRAGRGYTRERVVSSSLSGGSKLAGRNRLFSLRVVVSSLRFAVDHKAVDGRGGGGGGGGGTKGLPECPCMLDSSRKFGYGQGKLLGKPHVPLLRLIENLLPAGIPPPSLQKLCPARFPMTKGVFSRTSYYMATYMSNGSRVYIITQSRGLSAIIRILNLWQPYTIASCTKSSIHTRLVVG